MFNTARLNTEYHKCNLPSEPWDIVTRFIEGGMLVNLRRSLKRYMMINKRHPLTRGYAPSFSRLKEEERSHLIENYSMIHPLSMFTLHYNILASFVLLLSFVCGPITYPLVEDKNMLDYLMMPVNVIHLSMIIMAFNTGYYDMGHNIVTMDRCAVAKRYARTYLFFDLFTPQLLRLGKLREILQERSYYIPSLFVVMRYARYIWCLRELKTIRLYYGIPTFTFKAIKLILNMLVGLALAIYLLFSALTDIPNYHVQRFLKHSEATMRMLMMVNHGRRIIQGRIADLVIPACFILMGFIFHLIILVQTMEIWFKYFSAENQQTTVYDSIKAYMRYRALPISLRDRIYLYLEFKYQGHFYKESVIRKATSSFLRKEILLAATKESIHKVELFFKIPVNLLRKIRAMLTSEIFLPGDVIIKAGNTGQCMFFLLAGTVVVTSAEDKFICYLRDGSHFGEVALVVNIARVANVQAVTPCELFKLDRQQFWEVVKKYPEMWKEIERMATERIAVSGQTTTSTESSTNLTGLKLPRRSNSELDHNTV